MVYGLCNDYRKLKTSEQQIAHNSEFLGQIQSHGKEVAVCIDVGGCKNPAYAIERREVLDRVQKANTHGKINGGADVDDRPMCHKVPSHCET